ncbi:MAG: dicarboxylate/amino acid:cation symporter [Gemmatimonadetes bacterium]|nr:dicarboxylate/amino acid:cation symporter [Gemmatimonadota bacterium]
MRLHTRIFLGLAAGVAVGTVAKAAQWEWLQRLVVALEPVGTAFIRLVTMVVVPLVVASLITGIAGLGDVRRLGRIGGKTLAYFLATTLLAAGVGLGVALLLRPGSGLEPATRDAITAQFSDRAATAAATSAPGLVQSILDAIPSNPFAAAASGDLLPLIVAVSIFGAALTTVGGEGRRAVIAFFQGINQIAMVVIAWLMLLAPPAVFVLIAVTVVRSGVDLLQSLLVYSLVVVTALMVYVVVVLLPLLRVGAGIGVSVFFRSVSDALLLAFSTASSSATLPVSMAAAGRLGVPDGITSFLLPAGTTINKNGAAIYKAVTAVFLCHLYGIQLGASQLLTILLASTAAAFAGAGVPGSSLVTTLVVLNAVGLGPYAAAGIALVVGVDRPLDMCRTTVNTIGNLVGATVIARSERQAGLLAAEREMAGADREHARA